MSTHPQRFSPRRPATRARRLAAFLIVGPALWVVGLEAVAFAAHRGDAIAGALLVAGASFVLALGALVALRTARVREERAGAPRR
jgi:hypothetical protein